MSLASAPSAADREENQGYRAFRQTLEADRTAIVEALAETLKRNLPSEMSRNADRLRALIDDNLNGWLDAMCGDDFDALVTRVEAWCELSRALGQSPQVVLSMLEGGARVLFDVILRKVDEGHEHASACAERLLESLSQATIAYDKAFREVEEAQARKAIILRAVAENSPDAIGVAAADGHVQYVNPAFVKLVGRQATKEDTLFDFLHPDDVQIIHRMAEKTHKPGTRGEATLRYLRPDGTIVHAHASAFRVFGPEGETIARCGIMRDLTDEEQHAEERKKLEERILSVQAEALREVSAPIMPLAQGVIAIPLIGTISVERAERILQVMLEGIMQTEAGHVILDITGVPLVDAEVADAIARASKAAQLVGTEVLITGIRGAVAKTILELGVALHVDTWSTLRQGVAHAIAHERQKREQSRAQKRRARGEKP